MTERFVGRREFVENFIFAAERSSDGRVTVQLRNISNEFQCINLGDEATRKLYGFLKAAFAVEDSDGTD